ncbi:histidine--tRNA ligase [bacterium]|nr:histidine--tRNA ligase [bacterium]
MAQFNRVRGTQDFLDMRLFNHTVQTISKHVIRYGFQEISTPILEQTQLFKRILGQQTDVVHKEMYTFDSGDGSHDTCLRPEATASVARAFVEAGIATVPWRVFSSGPMFRRERPQKGRYRQFHQFNIEAIGVPSVMDDVQLIAMLDHLFDQVFNIDGCALQINFLGAKEDRAAHKVALMEFLKVNVEQLCKRCVERATSNTLRVFDCKNPKCQTLLKDAPVVTDYLNQVSQAEWQRVQDGLHDMGVSFAHNPRLVRGLDYYAKTVFEFVSGDLGAQDSFCAGGRYDGLIADLGSKQDYPSLGAAIGIERLMIMLEEQGADAGQHQLPLYLILPMSAEQETLALLLADTLRAAGLVTDVVYGKDSMKRMMRYADRVGAAYAVIVGSNEQASGTVTLKNMRTGDNIEVKQVELASYLLSL